MAYTEKPARVPVLKVSRARVIVGVLCGTLVGAAASAQPPDLVLLDGKIVTVDAAGSTHEALAIRDGRVLALGSTAEIRRLAGAATRSVDSPITTVERRKSIPLSPPPLSRRGGAERTGSQGGVGILSRRRRT